jgi:hypothetical protein
MLRAYLIMGRVVSGLGRVMSGCWVKNHGTCPTRHTCGSGRVSGFSYSFRDESGYFFSSDENSAHTRPVAWSGRVGFFRVGRVGQPMISYSGKQ